MTRDQFLALWNLKVFNEQAFQKYKDLGYMRRIRELPERKDDNYLLIDDEATWQNLLDKDEWYEQWQYKVEQHLSAFRENSTKYLLAFQNVNLNNWADTIANRLEKQMEFISEVFGLELQKHGLYVLHRSHYDVASKSLYLIQMRDRRSWKVRVIDFTKTSRPAQILEQIFTAPLEHHDFDDLSFNIGDGSLASISDQDRSLYYALQNINKKIDKDLGLDVGFLNIENSQVWIDSLHI